MDLWLCHEERNQCCYFSMLSIVMNNSVYRDSTGKVVDSNSSDMRVKVMVNWFASWLVFTDPPIMSYEYILGIYVMSRGRRHISRGIENAYNIMSLGYEMHILLLFYFEGNVSRLAWNKFGLWAPELQVYR
jgi:hypothetical protein